MYGILNLQTLHKAGDSLKISRTAPGKGYGYYAVALDLEFDGA